MEWNLHEGYCKTGTVSGRPVLAAVLAARGAGGAASPYSVLRNRRFATTITRYAAGNKPLVSDGLEALRDLSAPITQN